MLLAELHESSIRVYKVTPGSKGSDHPAVSLARLPNLPKHSRLPFTGSEISLQLMPPGQSRLSPLPGKTFMTNWKFLDVSASIKCLVRTKSEHKWSQHLAESLS